MRYLKKPLLYAVVTAGAVAAFLAIRACGDQLPVLLVIMAVVTTVATTPVLDRLRRGPAG